MNTSQTLTFDQWWEQRKPRPYDSESHRAVAEAAWLALERSELEALRARLAELEWRPRSVRPTKEDADMNGEVPALLSGTLAIARISRWDNWSSEVTHWRPAALPKEISPFDRWFAKHGAKFGSREKAEAAWKEAQE